jgi:hypothetical protein
MAVYQDKGFEIGPEKISRNNNDKVVRSLLQSMDHILEKNCQHRSKKCNALIHDVAHELRKSSSSDHLLQTTAIWVLINIYKLNHYEIYNMMLSAGIPGVLLDIMKSGHIVGTSRDYARELCMFLR